MPKLLDFLKACWRFWERMGWINWSNADKDSLEQTIEKLEREES